jgi:hypothetical protein
VSGPRPGISGEDVAAQLRVQAKSVRAGRAVNAGGAGVFTARSLLLLPRKREERSLARGAQMGDGMVWYGMVPLLPPVSVFCH